MLPDDEELERGIARIRTGTGEVTGSGFLVSRTVLCTCAHVVARALGTDEADPAPPAGPVPLDFPLLHPASAPLHATVTHWEPVAPDGSGDIALLQLEAEVPGTAPVRFAGGTHLWDHPFRVLGFPERTGDHGVWVRGRLRAPVGRGWTSMEAKEAFHGPAIGQGFSGSPVWDTEQGGVVGMTVAAEAGTGATTAYLVPSALLPGIGAAGRTSPFKGLEPFREHDAPVFFGRGADSERVAGAVRDTPFVPVAGASGVGKSSLVRAGVLPLLRKAGYTVTDFAGQPETDPVRTLAVALGDEFPAVGELLRELHEDDEHRTETAVLLGARILGHAGPAGHVVLLDQFEETIGACPADARSLLDVLLPMTRAMHPGGGRFRVLATLRSASLEELVVGGHAEELSGTVQMIAPMGPDQLSDVVRRPVEDIPGVEFQPGLAELVISDAGTEPGALPLVEFALAELWERQEHGRLTHAAYREIGGVEGALSRYADHQLAEVRKAPGGPDETIARRLFERLARPVRGREYARVARAFDQLPAELRTAAQALARTRLLVISRDSSGRETVALAHEALVRQWPTLRGWLDESRAFLAWHEKLRGRLREWEEGERHSDLLLRGQELRAAKSSAALRPAEITGAEHEFLRLSRDHHRRSVRRGRTGVVLVTCLALLAGMLGYGVWKLVRDKELERKEKAAQELVVQADARAAHDPVGAALLAAAAHRTSGSSATRSALMRYEWPLASLASAHRILPEGGEVSDVAASADGRVMAVLKGDEAYVVTGTERGEPEPWRLRRTPQLMDKVAVSDDGKRVAVAAAHGDVRVWQTERGEQDQKPRLLKWHADPRPDTTTDFLDFSDDGRRLVHGVNSDELPCVGDGLSAHLRVLEMDGRALKGERTALTDGLLRSGECVQEAALRPGEPDRLTVLVYAEDQGRAGAVLSVDLRTGQVKREPQELADSAFAAGGRALGLKQEGERHWRWQMSAGMPQETGGKWSESFDTDATGQYFVMGDDDTSDPDALWWLMQDVRSGRRYAVVVPSGVGDGTRMVVRRTDEGPVVHAAVGKDVLSLRMSPEPSYPLGGGETTSVTAMDRATEQNTLVALTDERMKSDDGSVGYTTAFEAVLDAHSSRHRRIGERSSLHEIVVSEDGRSFVAWGETDWDWRTTDFELRKGKTSPTADADSSPDMETRMAAVERFGRSDFLLLDGRGLAHLDGGTGEIDRLDDVKCAWNVVSSGRACVTAVGRPQRAGEFLLLRADGTAELWRLRGDGRAGKIDESAFPDLDASEEVMFRPDGKSVAAVTGRGVYVWRLAEEKPGILAPAATSVRAYDGEGHLVLTTGEWDGELWNDTGRGDPVELPAYDYTTVWGSDGHTLRGETALGPVIYDLDYLSGRADADEFCKTLPTRLVGVWLSLLDTADIPPEVDKSPPCPNTG